MPLDFIASNLKHTKPRETLDFIVPEQTLFSFGAGSGELTHHSGAAFLGQFLEARWSGEPIYHAPGSLAVGSWAEPFYLGVAGYDSLQFGPAAVVRENIIQVTGFEPGSFGKVQTSPSSDFIHSTGTILAKWEPVGYAGPIIVQIGSWSSSTYITPLGLAKDPSQTFGSTSVIDEKIIAPAGFSSTVFGATYVLRWYEYAPPVFTQNASWVGDNEYLASSGVVNVNWLPDSGVQTIAPVSFVNGVVSSPKVVRIIGPVGFDSAEFGNTTVDQPGCSNYAVTDPGNQVSIRISVLKTEYPGNQVPITFACDVPDEGEVTNFTGFIEAHAGELANTELENDIQITAEFYGGEEIPQGGYCYDSNALQNVGSSENTGAITTTGFRLQNPGNGTSGSLVATPEIDLSNTDQITFTWNQSLNGTWWDNGDLNSTVLFGVFFDRAHTSITSMPEMWEYDTPFDGYSPAPNMPWMNYWLPRDSGAKTITPKGRLPDGTASNLVGFTKAAGLDLYANSKIAVRLTRDSGKVRTEFFVNDVLLDSQLSAHDWPTSVVPLWYYRNYSNSASYVDVANYVVCSRNDILETYPSTDFYITADFYADAEVDVGLSTTQSLAASLYDGAYLDAVLDSRPGAELNLPVYDGGSSSFDLATTTTFDLNVYAGELADLVLDTRPPATLDLSFYADAESSIALWTRVSLSANAYADASVSFDLALNPAASLILDARDGPTAVLTDLSTAIQFGSTLGYDGTSVAVSLDSLENYKFYSGASATIELATETTIVPSIGADGTLELDLSIFPSEGMGTFRAYDGASSQLDIILLVQVLLYPNEIKDPHSFNWDVLGFMGIDLNNGTCCPVVDSHERIELTAGPAPDQRYDGDKTVFTASLSTLPRFSMEMFDGANFFGADPEYITFNFFDGTNGHISAVQNDYYNFNLCKGNFIPDGDFVNVELISTDLANCESTLIFDGASSNLDIEANTNFQPAMYEGPYMIFDLTLAAAWIINFWEGPLVRISNPELSVSFREGVMSSLAFEERDIVGYAGATMTISGLSTDYSVEFLERGCLDNEFVPANENGDADFDLFNPVPVELDFFTHSIQARCF